MLRKKTRGNYAFIDSQNLNVGTQNFGWKMNWRKFREWLERNYGVTQAFMFIGYVPENEELYESMHEAGYSVVLKPTFDMSRPRPEQGESTPHKEEERKIKGNIDADLVLWAMKELPNYNQAVLVSGDGDFYGLVEYLQGADKLKKVLVPNVYYSHLYNKYENYIERLDKSRRELAWHDRKFKRPKQASK